MPVVTDGVVVSKNDATFLKSSPELIKLATEFAEKQIALLITKGQLKAPIKKTNLEIASKTMDGGRYVKALGHSSGYCKCRN